MGPNKEEEIASLRAEVENLQKGMAEEIIHLEKAQQESEVLKAERDEAREHADQYWDAMIWFRDDSIAGYTLAEEAAGLLEEGFASADTNWRNKVLRFKAAHPGLRPEEPEPDYPLGLEDA